MCLGAFPSVNENLNEDLKNKIDNECGDFSSKLQIKTIYYLHRENKLQNRVINN